METTTARLEDDTIFATLGVGPSGTPNKMVCTAKTVTAVSAFATKPFTEGATIVAASGVHTHNWAVIGADKDGVCLSDPRSAPKTDDQWGTPYKADDNDSVRLKNLNWDKNDSSDKFPGLPHVSPGLEVRIPSNPLRHPATRY